MKFTYQAEPSDKVPLYGHDDQLLGVMHQNMVTATGDRCYGVLAFDCGNDKIIQIPVPWAIIRFNDRTGRYVAKVNRFELLTAPRFESREISGFDAEFASEIDAAYGLEFPGIESMNDLA